MVVPCKLYLRLITIQIFVPFQKIGTILKLSQTENPAAHRKNL